MILWKFFGEKGHTSNFGFLRDSNTGDYLGMIPLYNFDQVLQSNYPNDVLMQDTLQAIEQFPEYRQRAINIAETAVSSNLHSVFSEGVKVLLNALRK